MPEAWSACADSRFSGCLLITFAGLPGVGKSTVAQALAYRIEALYLPIDTIEEALRSCDTLPRGVVTEGYAAAYRIAADNLRIGWIVVADRVNPLEITRVARRAIARDAGVPIHEVEVSCSDGAEHRRRIEERAANGTGLVFTSWADVQRRTYKPWPRPRLIVDTAGHTIDVRVGGLLAQLSPDG